MLLLGRLTYVIFFRRIVNFFFSDLFSTASNLTDDVEFILSTNRGGPFTFKMDVNPQELIDHGFDPKKLTKIIVHGWNVDAQEEYCPPFVTAYINTFDYNVICLDWDKLANIVNYIAAAINSNTVGDFVGEKLVSQLLINSVSRYLYKLI